MRKRILNDSFLLLVVLLTQCKSVNKTWSWPNVKPPVAAIKPHERNLFGDKISDNYYWMIDYFKKGPDSTQVVDYLKAENQYLDEMMSGTVPLQTRLYTEMKSRIKEKDESVPVFKKGYYYYRRTQEGKQYFKYCRKKGSLAAAEEVLLDVDEMAKDHPYYSVSGFSISPDNTLLAFAVDTVSRRQYVIHVKDLKTGKVNSDAIHGTAVGVAWGNDNKTLFYTKNNPETLLTEKIMRHELGSPQTEDVIVYDEKDKSNYIGVVKSKSEQYVMIVSRATLSSEVRFLDADHPLADFKVFAPRQKDVLYDVYPVSGKFYVLTNLEAKNFRLMECGLAATGSPAWKQVIPHRPDVLLEHVDEFKNFLVITERSKGLSQLRILKTAGRGSAAGAPGTQDHHVSFDEPAYEVSTVNTPNYEGDTIRFEYASLVTPSSIYDYSMNQGTRKLLKQEEVLGGYDPKNYQSERLYATAADGTSIPISIVYKKGFEKNGTHPLLLYAYGSYGIKTDADFRSVRLSLLNRGFAFAIAHIRGGEDMGRQWYEDGKLMKKKNTFSDFIVCGRFLVAQKYTSPAHLYCNGASAGGLLMGAVTNLAPDLWHGVIAQVPFVDVVNTMLDESIPLTTNEFDEWGNPKQEAAYLYMKSYSPYENVERKAYPNILVTTGLHDSQVQYFEPAKWVAKLRALKTDKNVLLLHTNMAYGHGGASGRFDYLKDIALNYAFLLALENKID